MFGIGLVTTLQAGDLPLWSRGFSFHPTSGYTLENRFSLRGITQTGLHLTGECAYYQLENQTPRIISIKGIKTADGQFWPDVTSQVKNERTGKWETIAKPIRNGPRATITVKPGEFNPELLVTLDVFYARIGQYKLGRLLLKTGDSAEFELKDLLPSEEEKTEARNKLTAGNSNDSVARAPDDLAGLDDRATHKETNRTKESTQELKRSVPETSLAASKAIADTRLGSSIKDFLLLLGPPSDEEGLVRTASLKWNCPAVNGESVVDAYAVKVAFVDGIAYQIALRSRQRMTPSQLVKLTKPFVTTVRSADFVKPVWQVKKLRSYKLPDGTFVSANKYKRSTVVVIKGADYVRNKEISAQEAKIR